MVMMCRPSISRIQQSVGMRINRRMIPNKKFSRPVFLRVVVKTENQPPKPLVTVKGSKCKRSTSSYLLVRRKQLELEAVRKKAKIQTEVIEKRNWRMKNVVYLIHAVQCSADSKGVTSQHQQDSAEPTQYRYKRQNESQQK